MKVIYLRHGIVGYEDFIGVESTMMFIMRNEREGHILALCIYEEDTKTVYLPTKPKAGPMVDKDSLVKRAYEALDYLGITPIKVSVY